MTVNIPAPEGLWAVYKDSGELRAAPVLAFAGTDMYDLQTVLLGACGGAFGWNFDRNPGVLVYVSDGWLAKCPFPADRVHTVDTLPEEYRDVLKPVADRKPSQTKPAAVAVDDTPDREPVLSDPDAQYAALAEVEERDANAAKRNRQQLENAIVEVVGHSAFVTARTLPVQVGTGFTQDQVQDAADHLVRRKRIVAAQPQQGGKVRYYPKPRRSSYTAAAITDAPKDNT